MAMANDGDGEQVAEVAAVVPATGRRRRAAGDVAANGARRSRGKGEVRVAGSVTLYRHYNPAKDRGGEVLPGAKRMNQYADAVMHRVLHLRNVPSLLMGMNGEWIVDSVGQRVELAPDVTLCIRRVDRTDCDVSVIEMAVESPSKSATQLVDMLATMNDEYVRFVNNELGSRVYLFDQKERNDFRGNPFEDVKDEASRKKFDIMNAPKYLSFVKLPFYSNKTFDNMCGPEIRLLRKRIEFFVGNREWYDRKGIPYQLGILLSGEPGTGKSSCIRAIANFTGRHIVNVNFAAIRTVTQLKKLFYSEELTVYQNDELTESVKLQVPVAERIYVLEEIDAIGSVVVDRRAREKYDGGHGSNGNNPGGSCSAALANKIDDEITLGDILQVLDGNIETPGRILIITSNFPEVLDQALIRPGRIDLNLRFQNAAADTVAEMYEKFNDAPFPAARVCDLPDGTLSHADVTEVLFRHVGDAEAVVKDLQARAVGKREEREECAVSAAAYLQEMHTRLQLQQQAAAEAHSSSSSAAGPWPVQAA